MLYVHLAYSQGMTFPSLFGFMEEASETSLAGLYKRLANLNSGFTAGGSADPCYNTSYLVNASVEIGEPIIAVSLNYRVGGWGFLASKETVVEGASNIGLLDQRLALRWINENIEAFGGDPSKVTIAGESAGAFSVGYHRATGANQCTPIDLISHHGMGLKSSLPQKRPYSPHITLKFVSSSI